MKDKNGGMSDVNSGYSASDGTAMTSAVGNRIRGMAAADMSVNFYPALNLVPFDSYNTQSLDINRGPNSMLFGVGTPAGMVNQTTAQALLNQNNGSVSAQVASWDGFRATLSVNRSLIENKLAINVAAVYNETGFERKPSYDITPVRDLYLQAVQEDHAAGQLRALQQQR